MGLPTAFLSRGRPLKGSFFTSLLSLSRAKAVFYSTSLAGGFSSFKSSIKNEIGNPFRGNLSHFYWGYFAIVGYSFNFAGFWNLPKFPLVFPLLSKSKFLSAEIIDATYIRILTYALTQHHHTSITIVSHRRTIGRTHRKVRGRSGKHCRFHALQLYQDKVK